MPIVGEAGNIVGVISARDLRQMILEPIKFKAMAKPIGDFLTKGVSRAFRMMRAC